MSRNVQEKEALHTNHRCESHVKVALMIDGFGLVMTLNTLRPRQNGRRFAVDTFKRIFLNENVRISIRISLKFVPKGPINNIPALVQIMAWRRSGDKPLSEPMMVSLLTHICVTRPQWVNDTCRACDRSDMGTTLTHWGRVTHICVSKLITIGSDNDLSPARRQAIISTNVGILSTGSLGTNFSKIHTFSFKRMHLEISSGKCRPFCLCLDVKTTTKNCERTYYHMGSWNSVNIGI